MSPERRFNVLIIGAGPAGLAAACAAAQGGRRVGLVDDNAGPGGQIWRGEAAHARPRPPAAAWLEKAARSGVKLVAGTRVIGQSESGALLAEAAGGCVRLEYEQLILAPGARERFLPFEGWTLPNVMGAGGLQALVKSGLSIEGKSVVVAGSGPLLLAVAAYLRGHGATVRWIAEQAPRARIARFALSLAGSPGKLVQALMLKGTLWGVPYRTGCWPVAANGAERIESVTLTDGRATWEVACDYLACGFGLVPNTELPRLLGCAVRQGFVEVDARQQTSVDGIFCAGEATGIGGLEKSLVEGTIAGHVASGNLVEACRQFPARERARTFAAALERAFALRDELKALALPETIVCRCEDVTFAQLGRYDSIRAAKLQTRCGMGPCQGKVCGPALEFLFGWSADSVRPPVFPVLLGSLSEPGQTEG